MRYKRMIHDRTIFLLIISMTMTMVFFILGVVFFLSVHDERKMTFHYQQEKEIVFVGNEEILDNEMITDETGREYQIDKLADRTPAKKEVEEVIENLCSTKKANISMEIDCNAGMAGKYQKVKIYLNQAEDICEKIAKKYYEYSGDSNPYAFVGAENAYMVRNGSIKVNAQNIKVAGVLENKTIHDDNRIVLVNAIQNPGIKEEIVNTLASANDYTYIEVGSNEENLQNIDWAVLEKALKKLNRDVLIQDPVEEASSGSIDETLGKLTDKIFIGLTFFSLIHLISLDVMWFSKKRKDIAIMKTYGYSTEQLVGVFAKEYLLAVFAGIIFAAAATGLGYAVGTTKAIWDNLREAYMYSGFLILFIVLIMFLFVVHYAEKTAPADGVKER